MYAKMLAGRTYSREDWNDDEYDLEISQEEAVVSEAEANDLASEMTNDGVEAERAMDTADSMEDLAVIADSVDEATPTETALMQVAGDMAVAGTDVDSEDVVPATECFKGRRVAAEGFRETARNIWNAIKKFVKDIWDKLEKWFYKIFGAIPNLRKEVEKMRKRLEATLDEGKSIQNDGKKFELTNGLDSLKVGDKVSTKFSEVKPAASLLNTVIDKLLVNSSTITKYGEKLEEAINDFDGTVKPTPGADPLNKVVTKLFNGKISGYSSVRDLIDINNITTVDSVPKYGTNSDYSAKASDNLLGGKSLIVRVKKYKSSNVNNIEKLEQARSIRLEFGHLTDKPTKTKDSVNFETMKSGEIEDAMDLCEEILDTLEHFHRGKGKKDLEKARDNLIKACDQVEKDAGNVDEDDPTTSKAMLTNIRAVYKLAPFYSNIVATVTTQSYNLALQTVRTLLMISSRSLSQYSTK